MTQYYDQKMILASPSLNFIKILTVNTQYFQNTDVAWIAFCFVFLV